MHRARIPKRLLSTEERSALDRDYKRQYRARLSTEKRAAITCQNTISRRRSREEWTEKRSEEARKDLQYKRRYRRQMSAADKAKEAMRKRVYRQRVKALKQFERAFKKYQLMNSC